MKRWGVILAVVVVAGFGACRALPERYAVNAPLRQILFGRGVETPDDSTVESRIRVPDGFSLSLWAEGVRGARFLRFTETGDLLVSVPRDGRITLLERDGDGDGRSDGRRALLEGLDRPHGLDLHEGWLYVAETGAIVRARFDAAARSAGPVETVVPDLPSGGAHWTRNARFGPDGLLYVSIGSDCNACIGDDPRRAAVLRFQPDGSGEELFATGLRNAVGFDWQPGTGDLYATDNGRDLLGDDFPPCELNRLVAGGFYGWPFANGDRIPDPDHGEGRLDEIAASLPPTHGFRAHNAPLGITFVRGTALPAPYHGAAVVALHGSWNRRKMDGYRVVSLHFGPAGVEERDLVSGFELDGDVIGRPVDVAEGPDGALYISDDYGGAVYRLAFGEESRTPMQARVTKATAGNADPLASLADGERRRLAERGAALYAENGCAGCHEAGAGPEGMVVKPLRELSSRHDLEGLTAFLAAPTPPMPAVALDDAGRRSLAIHLLSRHP